MLGSTPEDRHSKLRAWSAAGFALGVLAVSALTAALGAASERGESGERHPWLAALRGDRASLDWEILRNSVEMLASGRRVFRYDTFGSEEFWGGQLRLHEALAGVDPATALAVGLKVDVEALQRRLVRDLRRGRVDLEDPAVTVALLQLDAVVGVKGFFDGTGHLESVGIRCSLCHSTVDDSLAPGIGRRRDGWANRDLDVGAIIALAPDLSPFADLLGVSEATVRQVLGSWGPGRFDASLSLDGKAFRDDGASGAVLIPPAFGLAGVNLHTWTGWGSVSHWNALVAVLEMHGKRGAGASRARPDPRRHGGDGGRDHAAPRRLAWSTPTRAGRRSSPGCGPW